MPRLTPASVKKLKAGKERREIADSGSPGLFLVIQRSGTKSWALRYRNPHGHSIKLTLGRVDFSDREVDESPVHGQHLNLVQARRLAAEVHRQRAVGLDVHAELRRMKLERNAGLSNIFDAQALDFVEQYLKRNVRRWEASARLLGIAPDSEGVLRFTPRGLSDRWRDKPINTITTTDLEWVVDETFERGVPGLRRRNGNRQSSAMAHQMFSVLRGLFKWLFKKKRIKVNPCIGLTRPDVADNSRTRWLNDDEIKKFWTACDQIDEPARQCLRLLLLTGARLNEIARLLRSEVDGGTINLSGERTKNRLPFTIPLPPLAQEILSSVRTKGDYYFTGKSGRLVGPWSRIKQRLDGLMDIPDWRLHDLRRTFSTNLNKLGVRPEVVEAALNHISGAKSNVAGTYNRWHYLPEKFAALALWADHVSGLVQGRTAKVVAMNRKTQRQ